MLLRHHRLTALDWTGLDWTDRPKPICPLNFFEVGGIKREITLTELAPSPLNLPERKNMGPLNFHIQTTDEGSLPEIVQYGSSSRFECFTASKGSNNYFYIPNFKILALTIPDRVLTHHRLTDCTHARTHSLTHCTDRPKPICPLIFFEVGGIKTKLHS